MQSPVEIIDDVLHVTVPMAPLTKDDLIVQVAEALKTRRAKHIKYFFEDDAEWSSRTLAAIRVFNIAAQKFDVKSDYSAIPSGAAKILSLSKPPINDNTARSEPRPDIFESTASAAFDAWKVTRELGVFVRQSLGSFKRFFLGKAQYQRSDLLAFIQAVGPQALLIVSLVNILLGVILAFMGAVQLKQFGAEIYVANLVALGLTRDIAPMMTAIILAGRTGAAYAAQLGTMQVNEEIDALKTFGFSPMDFLVLPRMMALAIMMPLLVLYADAIGIFGGYLVGMSMLGIGAVEYIVQTQNAIGLTDISVGIVKGSIFGVLVAITGCMQGMRSGRSASAVGNAATSAVVSGIVSIIVATALFAFLTNALGI